MLSKDVNIINGMVRTKDSHEWWHENEDKYKFYNKNGRLISNDAASEEYKGYSIKKNNDNKYDLFLNNEEKGYNFDSPEKAKRRVDQYLTKYSKDSQTEIDFQGLKVIVENEVGSTRKGIKEDGTKWETKFQYPYGYIRGALKDGDDGEELDCYVGPNPNAGMVFIIHQSFNGYYDELKCLLGFDSEEDAKAAYIIHYDLQQPIGTIVEMSMNDFKTFIGVQEV